MKLKPVDIDEDWEGHKPSFVETNRNNRLLFYGGLLLLVLFSGFFLYQVFIKTEACALNPLSYWSSHFTERNGEYNCVCHTADMSKDSFHFSGSNPQIKNGVYSKVSNNPLSLS